MSDPAKLSVEIEDVLASIRRLVSDTSSASAVSGARVAIRPAVAPAADADAGSGEQALGQDAPASQPADTAEMRADVARLVLTASFRVDDAAEDWVGDVSAGDVSAGEHGSRAANADAEGASALADGRDVGLEIGPTAERDGWRPDDRLADFDHVGAAGDASDAQVDVWGGVQDGGPVGGADADAEVAAAVAAALGARDERGEASAATWVVAGDPAAESDDAMGDVVDDAREGAANGAAGEDPAMAFAWLTEPDADANPAEYPGADPSADRASHDGPVPDAHAGASFGVEAGNEAFPAPPARADGADGTSRQDPDAGIGDAATQGWTGHDLLAAAEGSGGTPGNAPAPVIALPGAGASGIEFESEIGEIWPGADAASALLTLAARRDPAVETAEDTAVVQADRVVAGADVASASAAMDASARADLAADGAADTAADPAAGLAADLEPATGADPDTGAESMAHLDPSRRDDAAPEMTPGTTFAPASATAAEPEAAARPDASDEDARPADARAAGAPLFSRRARKVLRASGDDPVAGDVADEEAGAAAFLFEDGEAGLLDEDTLREIIVDVVREELQGVLGQRITRNVRKLVRREVRLALAADDLE